MKIIIGILALHQLVCFSVALIIKFLMDGEFLEALKFTEIFAGIVVLAAIIAIAITRWMLEGSI